jgi:hypothetical protein
MLEKSGSIVLTQTDLDEFHKGVVSERVKNTWHFTLAQLSEIINSGNFVTIKD